MTASDLLKGCPLFLQKRYSSLGQHVRSVIETEFPDLDLRKVPREDIETLQLISFVFVLTSFFKDSHLAAKKSVDTFADLGVNEFRIGSASFHEGSESVEAGRILGEQMLESISDDGLRTHIRSSENLGELLAPMIQGIQNV